MEEDRRKAGVIIYVSGLLGGMTLDELKKFKEHLNKRSKKRSLASKKR